MEKKVSVIIPFYKGVNWLEEAVQSVLNQTYKNIEIIVVNDGSPEDDTEFLDMYGDKVIYIRQKNQGAAIARNNGIRYATGDYIAFEDSDDVWMPTKLEKQIQFMEKNGFAWSHTGFNHWWPKTGKRSRVNNSIAYDDMKKQFKVSCRIATPTVVVHRSTVIEHQEIGFATNRRVGEDTAYWRGLAEYYKLALIEEPLVDVRMRDGNSYTNVLFRFEEKAFEYKEKKHTQPSILKLTGMMYLSYYKLFGTKRAKIKEFVAKCFWVIPFTIERMYLHFLILGLNKDKRYILRISVR